MVFDWSLSDSKSPQVSRTRLRILAVLSNAVILIVPTRPPTSKSSRPFNNPLVIVPKAPITICTIVTFMFHSFFNSLVRSRYISFFSHSFRFILWSAGTAKSTILQILFFFLSFFFFNYYKVEFLAGIRWSVCMLKPHCCCRYRTSFDYHVYVNVRAIKRRRKLEFFLSLSFLFFFYIESVIVLSQSPSPCLTNYFLVCGS